MLIKSLPDESFDDCLPAHIEFLSSTVQFLQHTSSDVDVDTLNGLNHAALAFEESTDVLALIRELGDGFGGNRSR